MLRRRSLATHQCPCVLGGPDVAQCEPSRPVELSIGGSAPAVSSTVAAARARHAPSGSTHQRLVDEVAAGAARCRPGRRGRPRIRVGHRPIKTTSKAWAVDMAISIIDLTVLEGADTEARVRSLCAKAIAPDACDPATPLSRRSASTATLSPAAVDALKASNVQVAAVTLAFPPVVPRWRSSSPKPATRCQRALTRST
jgi:hypothetical protein